ADRCKAGSSIRQAGWSADIRQASEEPCLPLRGRPVIEALARSRVSIVVGGDLAPAPRLARDIAGARVIAADSGMRHAAALGVAPELWTGDFDSVPERLLADWAGPPRAGFR